MLSFPNAKINLGLSVLSRRADGYHNLESCFYPIPWCDVLEIIPAKEFSFSSSGLSIPGSIESNLCVKAFQLLKVDFAIPNVHIHLHKVIPMGAGLGGGSSDGAFALKMLNELFGLGLATEKLQHYAAQLGSDCPFFIANKPVMVHGTGTEFSPIDVDLAGKHLTLQHPGIHVGTKEAYSKVIPRIPQVSVSDVLRLPGNKWKELLKNDFEESVFSQFPEIKSLKESMYAEGALYASMSGSGSAVYGIFDKKPDVKGIVFQL